MITSKNPFTGTILKEYDYHTDDQVLEFLERSHDAFLAQKKRNIHERGALMMKVSDILEKNKDEYATIITQEMGKLKSESISEVEKCAWVCRFYAEKAAGFLMDTLVKTDASLSKISYQPLGTILAVMPWNFPFWQVFRFAAPTLMAGNTGLLKHASNVPQSALLIQKIFEDAGWTKGTFQTLLIHTDKVSELIEDDRIKAVTLTGSGPAGRAVAGKAAQELKKAVLELGGSDPYIILKDAAVDEAAKICAQGRMMNAGQSCIGAKRFIVVQDVYEDFLSKFRAEIEAYIPGDPILPSTNLAPMATKSLRDDLHQQVLESIASGCHLLTGGHLSDEIVASFYPPTILTEITKDAPAYKDELFGPVASVFRVKDESEAIQLANDSMFGLGAAIFSTNVTRAEEIAIKEIEAGNVFINAQVKSDPRLPFGGIKQSGFGRELSKEGILEFVNTKTIYRK